MMIAALIVPKRFNDMVTKRHAKAVLALTTNIGLELKWLTKKNTTSLLQNVVNHGIKRFICTGPKILNFSSQ